MDRLRGGVTLLEILVIVTILAILFSIAIPMLLRSKMVANEGSAIGSLRSILAAQAMYCRARGEYGDLAGLAASHDIDVGLGAGTKSGYKLKVSATAGATWDAQAVPEIYDSTGIRCYFVDESGILRGRDNGDAKFQARAVCQSWPPIQ